MAIIIETLVDGTAVNATPTPTADKVPIADGSGNLAAGWGGAASSLATLDGSGAVVEDPNAKAPKWTLYTIGEAAFTAAAAAEDIELFSLPARGVIHEVVLKHTTSFTGGVVADYTLSVGIVGVLDKYSAAFDVFQATGDAVFSFNALADMEDLGSATSIRVNAASASDDVADADAGSCDIWVLWSVLPV